MYSLSSECLLFVFILLRYVKPLWINNEYLNIITLPGNRIALNCIRPGLAGFMDMITLLLKIIILPDFRKQPNRYYFIPLFKTCMRWIIMIVIIRAHSIVQNGLLFLFSYKVAANQAVIPCISLRHQTKHR